MKEVPILSTGVKRTYLPTVKPIERLTARLKVINLMPNIQSVRHGGLTFPSGYTEAIYIRIKWLQNFKGF